MLKQPHPTLHKTTRTEITALFGETKLVLEETPKAISPFGGLASFIAFLGQLGFAREVQQRLPFAEPTSNNAIPLAHAFTAFLMAVVVAAQRFAHSEWLRADRVLHALLGLERFPSDDTIRNFFLRFSQGHIEAFWRPLWRWLLRLVKCPAAGFALDLDSTVFCREGTQEGARKGFNPRRKGRNSHHPLLAVLAEAPFILHGWLRSGNTGAARGVVPFLQEALALLPEGRWLRTVRADSGFFDGSFLDFLEERALPYVVVARLTSTFKRKCAGIKDWMVIENLLAYYDFLPAAFLEYGLPLQLHVAFHSFFFTHTPDSLTQLGQALRFYGVSFLYAPTPQAKGKVEREHQYWQNRLPAYFASENISDLAQANPQITDLRRHRNQHELHSELQMKPQQAWDNAKKENAPSCARSPAARGGPSSGVNAP